MTNKSVLALAVSALLVTGGAWFYNKNASSVGAGPIKIGVIAPLTGPAAPYGEPIKDAIAIALDEINKSGGVNGREIVAIYEDGKCNGKDAASAAQKLVSVDGVKIIIGGACSSETLAAAPITEAAKVILLSTYSSNPAITQSGDFVFRNHVSDSYAGEMVAQAMLPRYKKAAIISEKTDYAQGIKAVFLEKHGTLSGEITASEDFSSDTNDFRSILQKVRSSNPETIYLNAQSGEKAGLLAKQARELGMGQQFFIAFTGGPEFLAFGKPVEGTIVIDDPGFNLQNKKAVGFNSAYKARFGKEPSYPFPAGASYDAVYLFKEAIEKHGGKNTEKIKNYLYGLKNFDGVVGSYHFDENGDVAGLKLAVKKVVGGKLVE